jgi:chromosome segregation ATPase
VMKRNFSFLFLRRSKFVDEDLSLQSMLLRKALQMQQDLEDKKNEIIIEGLENKIKEYEASLEKKDFLLQAMEGSLAEAQAENTRLNRELLQKSESFEQERKSLQTKYEAEAVENTKLQQSLKELRNMCLGFGSRCVQRLKRFLTQFEPALKSLPLRPKTYQAPSNTLKAKSRRLTK